jgi:hypothetical protein
MIGLWIWDELSYNKYFKNYDKIAQVMQHQNFNGEIGTQEANPAVMAGEIRSKYGSDFKYVLQSSWNFQHTLALGEKKLLKSGSFFEPQVTEMLALKMLRAPGMVSRNLIPSFFPLLLPKHFSASDDPINKTLRIDNQYDVKVTGVYEDIPYNSSFREVTYLMPWELYLIQSPWIQKMENPWGSNFTQTFAQITDNANFETVSEKDRQGQI